MCAVLCRLVLRGAVLSAHLFRAPGDRIGDCSVESVSGRPLASRSADSHSPAVPLQDPESLGDLQKEVPRSVNRLDPEHRV